MNINIEEMKAAVLAECERICPNRGDRHELNGVLLLLENFGSGWLFCMSFPEGTEIDLVSVARYTQDWSFVWAYRLLGLEAKAKDAEIQRLKTHLANVAIEARRHEANSCWDFRDYVAGLAERVAPEVSEIDRLRAEVDRFKKASTEALESAKSLYGETPIYLLGIELVNSEALKGGQNG